MEPTWLSIELRSEESAFGTYPESDESGQTYSLLHNFSLAEL
jgi:hypothetical protein